MKTRTPVWAINYQNQIDDYFERVSEADLIKAEVELFDMMSKHSGQSPAECRQLLKEELGKLPKRETESVKKRFSWAGVIGFLFVFAMVAWLTYSFVEGF